MQHLKKITKTPAKAADIWGPLGLLTTIIQVYLFQTGQKFFQN